MPEGVWEIRSVGGGYHGELSRMRRLMECGGAGGKRQRLKNGVLFATINTLSAPFANRILDI
jgi:hypothetical protein